MGKEINKVYCNRSETELQSWPDNFFDSCVTDPPWKIQFMNKHWDYELPSIELWKEVWRVLKPGAHILVCCGTRTQHRMVVNIEDAGFEIRDVIAHHYGSGFPKSMDVSKQLDKEAGAEREVIGQRKDILQKQAADLKSGKRKIADLYNAGAPERNNGFVNVSADITEPATAAAKEWDGWGTALKPATEFWTLARKPIEENTIAANVLKYGTGGLNIDASRIQFINDADKEFATFGRGTDISGGNYVGATHGNGKTNIEANPKGRFPANLILSHSPDCSDDQCTLGCPVRIMNEQAPAAGAFAPVPCGVRKHGNVYNEYKHRGQNEDVFYGDSGGAARFFYCPKPDTFEREKGLKDFELNEPIYGKNMSSGDKGTLSNSVTPRRNDHPTVKSITLMSYLVKMITQKGGIVLDPFCGSGSTLIGAKMELMNWVGIDMVEKHCKISEARVAAWNPPKYKEQTLF